MEVGSKSELKFSTVSQQSRKGTPGCPGQQRTKRGRSSANSIGEIRLILRYLDVIGAPYARTRYDEEYVKRPDVFSGIERLMWCTGLGS